MAGPAAGGNPIPVHVVEVSGTEPRVLRRLPCALGLHRLSLPRLWELCCPEGAGVVPEPEGDVGVPGSPSLAHPRLPGAGTQLLPVFALVSPVPVGRDGRPLPRGAPRRAMRGHAARVGRGRLGTWSASGDSGAEGRAVPGGAMDSLLST